MRRSRSSRWVQPTLPSALAISFSIACGARPSQFESQSSPPVPATPSSTRVVLGIEVRRLPADRQRTLQTVRDFLSAVEEARAPEAGLMTSDARLVAKDSGRARPLLSALLERAAPPGSAGAPKALHFQAAQLSLLASESPDSGDARVLVPLDVTEGQGSPAWLVRVRATAQGLRVSEVLTDDGSLR